MKASTNQRFDPTDPDVIARLQSGDEQELGNLWKFFRQRLSNFVLNKVRNFGTYEDAEEIASDALRTIYYEIGKSYDPQKARLSTWMYSIAQNKAVNFIRKQKKLKEKAKNLAEQEPKGDKRRKSFEDSYGSEISERARAALSEEDQNILRAC